MSVLTPIANEIATSSGGIVAVWILSCLNLIADGLYLNWYSSGRSFKSTAFTTVAILVLILCIFTKQWDQANLSMDIFDKFKIQNSSHCSSKKWVVIENIKESDVHLLYLS